MQLLCIAVIYSPEMIFLYFKEGGHIMVTYGSYNVSC